MDTTVSTSFSQVDLGSLSSPNGNHENGTGSPGSNGAHVVEANGVAPASKKTVPNRSETDPYRLAALFLRTQYTTSDGVRRLVNWQREYLAWNGSKYQVKSDAEIEAELTRCIQQEFDRINVEKIERMKANGEIRPDNPPPFVHKVGRGLVRDTELALRSLCLIRVEHCRTPPKWIGENPLFRAGETIPFRNALVHLPSLASGRVLRVDPTPRFFSLVALDFDFVEDAPVPGKWLNFLDSVWGDDPDSIDCLQEWFGYCLTQGAAYQKMLMVIGAPRSGKGTIARVLTRLVGAECSIGPTLASLATNFGLSPFPGKSLAVIADARIRRGLGSDGVMVERLLSISGGDAISIDRKYKDPLTMTLPTKIMLLSNQLPEFRDASQALANRFIYLHMKHSFLGREDAGLFNRLVPELPGILHWAVEGWRRLADRGRFVQPESGVNLAEEAMCLNNPIVEFVAERCEAIPGFNPADELWEGIELPKVSTSELHAEWMSWCEINGVEQPGGREEFGRNLRAAYPCVQNKQVRLPGGGKDRFYVGIRLLTHSEMMARS